MTLTSSHVSSEEMVLLPGKRVERSGVVTWSASLRGPRTVSAFVEHAATRGRHRPTARPWLLAFLPIAMRSGRSRLVVDGPVDAGTIANLMEWQELHHHWWPKSTCVVEIRADVVDEPRVPRRAGAVTCFSGGVDSAFTLLRHAPGAADGPYRRTRLAAGLMVHGFDMSHRDDVWFPGAWERTARMLRAHGVDPLWLRTDLRREGRSAGLGWGKVAHGPALAAALAFVEQAHDVTLIPSTYPYRHGTKWGSTPLADPLLGSGARPLWHDGAAHDKLDKILAIAHDPAVAADLRVCFVGGQHDRNCGTCFKCLATQAGFWLAGVDAPAAFPRRATLEEVSEIELKDPYKVALGRHVVREARRRERADVERAVMTALDRVGATARTDA